MLYKYWQPAIVWKGQRFRGRWIYGRKELLEKIYDIEGLIVVQSFRTALEQRNLYALGRTKPGRIVTYTLDSNHLRGMAIDIYWEKEYLQKYGDILRSRGFKNDVPGDRGHFTPYGEVQTRVVSLPIHLEKKDAKIFVPEKNVSKVDNTKEKTMFNSHVLSDEDQKNAKYKGKDFSIRLAENYRIINSFPRSSEFLSSSFNGTWHMEKKASEFEHTMHWWAANRSRTETAKAFSADYDTWARKNPIIESASNNELKTLVDKFVKEVDKLRKK